MTIALRANNDGTATVIVGGQTRMTFDASGNILGSVTPPYADSSTKLATTSFVGNRSRGYKDTPVISASTVLTANDVGKNIICNINTSSVTVTLPSYVGLAPGSVITLNVGDSFTTGNNRLNIVPVGGQSIFGSSQVSWTNANALVLGTGERAEIVFNGVVWQLVDSPILLGLGGPTFQGVNSVSGYKKLPGGLILQWGQADNVASATSTAVYPIPFPNGAFQVVACGFQVAQAQAYATVTSTSNNDSFAWTAWFAFSGSAPVLSSQTGQVRCKYVAIGN